MIEEPVSPFDHTVVPAHPVAVSNTASPEQIVPLSLLIVGLFGFPTVIIISFDFPLVQVPDVQVAENVVVVATLTVILVPVEAFDQTTVPVQPAAVNVTLPGSQRAVIDAEIVGAAFPPVVITIALEFPLSPHVFVHVAV